jgi:pyrroloquinoline quinone biosynthesis protein B
LTSAEIDHTLGLLTLREAGQLTVYATSTVRRALAFSSILDAYTAVTWQCIEPHKPTELGAGLTATAFAVGVKRPRFAAAATGRDWTVAYLFNDARTGGRLIYAPGLSDWHAELTAQLQSADVVILDGTFATANEMSPADIGAMGHLPVEETLPLIKANPGPSYVYTHLNNTNPMALPGNQLSDSLHAAGAHIAADGDLFDI